MAFISLDQMTEILEELVDELPQRLFDGLNQGIIIKEEAKLHAQSKPERPLYILGEYTRSKLGKQILIYYGSFKQTHGHLSQENIKDKLRDTLRHEFRHHWEYLAGEQDLAYLDDEFLRKYIFGTER
ncbi:MAG: metallopeptidase family protein [Tissierellia bacterium]|jgi:predicted Zn-dependent protease with MMP-like domain|nr:metallopeptidase family protein [Tissierellia bacterium]